MNSLASTYREQRRWGKAEELELHVLEISKTKIGGESLLASYI
jgi:hypothetical protein